MTRGERSSSWLYPPEVYSYPVIEALPVPRIQHARAVEGHTFPYPGRPAEYYEPESFLWTFGIGSETIAVMDKAYPHARYELMILVADDDVKSGPASVGRSTLRRIGHLAHDFVRYVSEQSVISAYDLEDAEVTIGFNFDPYTTDRSNGQFWDKRMHWHLNCWPRRDIDNAHMAKFGRVRNSIARRSLIDPIAFVAAEIMSDRIDRLPQGYELVPHAIVHDSGRMLPIGFKIRLPGWSAVGTTNWVRVVRKLHGIAERTYREIYRAFTGLDLRAQKWSRPQLLEPSTISRNLENLGFLSDRTRRCIERLAVIIRSVDESQLVQLESDLSLAERKLLLAGLDYHMGLYSPHKVGLDSPISTAEEVYLYMQFKVFGAAGTSPPLAGALAANFDRSSGPTLTPEELRSRAQFQRGYVEFAKASVASLRVDP